MIVARFNEMALLLLVETSETLPECMQNHDNLVYTFFEIVYLLEKKNIAMIQVN